MKKLIPSALFSLLLLPGLLMAQNTTISGSVVDENGDPLNGANVLIEELVLGVSTDLNGHYSFIVPASLVRGQRVIVRTGFIGYLDQTRLITLTPGEQTQDFHLSQDLLRLDEVVVTGVTEATPTKKLAFTVNKLDTDKLQQAPGSSAVESMQGKIPGVSIIKNSGAPGEALSVRLRGSTSISGGSAPLYIVDGVILGSDQVDIDVLDVESMEVIKGAAASSLYGARAQNGVVNITTRRGNNLALNQTRVTIRNEFGINDLEKNLKANNSHNFQQNSAGEFLDADGNVIPYGLGVVEDNAFNGMTFADNPYAGPTYDVFGTFFEPGNAYTNYISIARNGLKTNFHASFTNLQEGGDIVGLDGYSRKSARVNLDHRISSGLSFSASGYYARSFNDSPRAASSESEAFFNPFRGLMFMIPTSNLANRDENGELMVKADPLATEENPLYIIDKMYIENRRTRTLGNIRARYVPANWIKLEAGVSIDRSDRTREEFYDRGFESILPSPVNEGRIERRNGLSEVLNYDVTASFRKTLSRFTLRSYFSYQHELQDNLSEFAIGSPLASEGIRDLSNVSEDSFVQVGDVQSRVVSDGYYGTFGIDYQDKYMLDFLIRRDGSSLFGRDERWHNYFRASGAYRVSEESWWPGGKAVPEFKLRASFGTAGGRPSFEAQYERVSLNNGNLEKNTLGNSLLKPEHQAELELGVDMAISDRILAEFVYADSRVEDQLLLVPLPDYFGYTSQWQNAGTLESNTIEASLNANLIHTLNMSLDIGVIFDRTRQEIAELDMKAFRGGPQTLFYFREGEILGAIYGERWMTGIADLPTAWASSADQFQINDDGYLVPVGDASYTDGISRQLWGTTVNVNGDALAWGMPVKMQDEENGGALATRIADMLPDYNLGMPIYLRYKRFSASLLLNAQFGGDVYNFTKQYSYRDGRASDQDQAGKNDGLKKPTDYYAILYDAQSANAHFVENGTYVKLRELSLGFSFDRQQLEKIFGSMLYRVAISLTGRNLLTFTNYSGFDPEVGTTFNSTGAVGSDASLYRVDNLGYPNYRTYTARLEIQF